ncbi:EbsA family protein [Gordonia sp. 'Campus']|uniref:EbsA family protein n=1 Tax=Gordonia sp. 'Campus' TaxID=2915824 RepID=UPI001EE4545F|nr:EbsA family protein [Gordonia sp. 'Campus']
MSDETPDATGPEDEAPVGETLFYEPGGSWWVVLIGPLLVGGVLAVEIAGPGQVHWPVLAIFFVILLGFSVVQVSAARRHVSVELTETTLRQGAVTIPLSDIEKVFPPNHGAAPEDWESASALGELHGVPRRRKGIGVELTTGTLAQAWARDIERFRSELTQAHEAVRMGLPPRSSKRSTTEAESQDETE